MSASCPKHLLSDGVEALLCTHVHTHIVKTPAGTRFGSIAMHAHAHPIAQRTCSHTVWKHCYTHTCPPMCSKHLQAHCLEALLYTHMPTHVLKTPAGALFGSIAIHTSAHQFHQRTCRHTVWRHCYTRVCPKCLPPDVFEAVRYTHTHTPTYSKCMQAGGLETL